jgi:hypothetical protein
VHAAVGVMSHSLASVVGRYVNAYTVGDVLPSCQRIGKNSFCGLHGCLVSLLPVEPS